MGLISDDHSRRMAKVLQKYADAKVTKELIAIDDKAAVRKLRHRILELEDTKRELEENQEILTADITTLEALIATGSAKTFTVDVTAYTASADETDDTPNVTAFMEAPVPGKTCAVSRDLKAKLAGKEIWVEGVGRRRVNDLVAARFQNTVDIVMNNKHEAFEFGRQSLQIIVLN